MARRVIDGVVAITFTEAAAAEMATRIGEALAGLALGDQPIGWMPGDVVAEIEDEEIAARAAALGGEVHRLPVTTIHAFCQRVLTAHPFEAGLHPHFEIDADRSVLEALVDEVVEEALRGLDDDPRREAWELLAARLSDRSRSPRRCGAWSKPGPTPPICGGPVRPCIGGRFTAELEGALADFFSAEAGLLVAVPRNRITEDTRAALAVIAKLDSLGSRAVRRPAGDSLVLDDKQSSGCDLV